ncbi:MAG: hypothetical protein GC152_01655 [Alphaproteobacteria bacterium]|nr:hypothetical protein [Alphaproteobacteria bacterium]
MSALANDQCWMRPGVHRWPWQALGAIAFALAAGAASAGDKASLFDDVRLVSVLFTGPNLQIAEAVAARFARDERDFNAIDLASVWGSPAIPPAPTAAPSASSPPIVYAENAAAADENLAEADTAPGAPAQLSAPMSARVDANPAADAGAASVYGAILPEPPNESVSLIDASVSTGADRQYRRSLGRPDVETTDNDFRVTSVFTEPPATEGSALSLRDVIVYTLKNNPDIGIALWQAADAQFAVRGAKSPLLPSVEFSGSAGLENTFIENAESGGAYGLNRREASVRFSQLLYDFGRSAQLLKRARALYQSRELAFDDAVEDTVLAAVTAYLDLLASTELLENAKQNVREHEAIFSLVRINYEGGNTSEAELKRARTRLDRARTQALDVENLRENAINNFRRVTQLEPGRLIEPSVDVSKAAALNEQTVDLIIADSFEVQSFARDQNSIEHQLKATRRSYLPEVSLEVVGRYQDNVLGNVNGSTEGRAMVAARWNLYDGGLASSRASQLRARKRENEQRIVKLRNELREEAFNIISVLRTTADKTAIFNEQVESSRRVVELYSKQFEAGRRTLLELLDAQADFAEARQESISNKYENLSASFASLRFQNYLTPVLAAQLDFPAP